MLLDRSRPLSPFARRGFAFAFAVLLVLAVAGASHFGTPLVRAATPLPAPLAPVSPDHLTPLPGTPAPPAAMRGDVVAYGDDGEVIDPDQLANEVEARLADVQAQLEAEVEAAAAQAAEQSLPAAERRAVANRAREQAERAMAQAKREIELQVAAEMRTAARELRIANGEEWDECRGVEPRIPRRDVIALLEESFVKDPDPQVRSMALDRLTCWDRSLARIDGLWTQTADAEMKSLLMDRLAQLAARGDDGALNRLVRLTGESDEDLAAMAISHLGAIGSPRATEALAAILGSRRPAQLRAMALEGLSRGNSAEGLEALKRAARSDRDAEVRAHALALLSEPRFDSEVPPAPPSPPTAPLPPGVPAAPHAE